MMDGRPSDMSFLIHSTGSAMVYHPEVSLISLSNSTSTLQNLLFLCTNVSVSRWGSAVCLMYARMMLVSCLYYAQGMCMGSQEQPPRGSWTWQHLVVCICHLFVNVAILHPAQGMHAPQ